MYLPTPCSWLTSGEVAETTESAEERTSKSLNWKQKNTQKRFHDHYCLDDHLGIDGWDFTLFEQCETHKQLKERETFWQH